MRNKLGYKLKLILTYLFKKDKIMATLHLKRNSHLAVHCIQYDVDYLSLYRLYL